MASKDPAYSDVVYVEQLIAPGVINTMPEQTLRAFADHGEVAVSLDSDDAPEAVLRAGAVEGVELRAITVELEHEGVAAFCDSHRQLLSRIESKLISLSAIA